MATPKSGISKPNAHSQSSVALSKRTLEFLKKYPRMLSIRTRFIEEYIKDFKGPAAYIRAGGPATTATKMSSEFLREPWVSKQISDLIDSLEESKVITNQRILAGLVREAHYEGLGASHSARVSALMGLAKIKGMVQEKLKIDGNMKVQGGVMLVPMPSNAEEWEKLAQTAQEGLRASIRGPTVDVKPLPPASSEPEIPAEDPEHAKAG